MAQINTTNSENGWSQWPWTDYTKYWEAPPIKGFEW
jgi:hypothetical protein